MVSLDEIRAAGNALAGRIHRTPLLSSQALGQRAGCSLFFKAESLQKTGSFKVRGVFNKIRRLDDAERKAGLIAVSAGNHAQALAYAAGREGLKSTIVMPANASPAKAEASRGYGANIVLHGTVFDAFNRMEELRREHGYTLVHPYDDEAMIAGHGTIGIEILEDVPDVDVVVVPVGGGGLISGIAAAIKQARPGVRVYGVEPFGAAALTEGLRAGKPVRLEKVDTIADGLAAPATGQHVLEHVNAFVDDVVLVTDDDIRDALRAILQRCKIVVEAAGAAAAAAVLANRIPAIRNARVVAVASGGNIDLSRLQALLT